MSKKQLQELLDSTKEIARSLGSISESLGEIAGTLGDMSLCVDHIPPNPYCPEGRSIFRIGGHVDTENY